MADSVVITIEGDYQAGPDIAAAKEGLGDLGSTSTSSGGMLDGLMGKLSGVGSLAAGVAAGGLAALIGGLVAGGSAAVDFAGDMNQAQRDLQASLSITDEAAKDLSTVTADLFKNNWGDSIEDVNAAVIDIQQQFKGLGGIGKEETEKIASGAFALRDSFGGETTEYISAARTLMEQFGISGTEAMDFITSGMQGGLNASGDFLDSIGEYSTQFANGGATAGQFFSVMETGLGSGVLGTDKAADLFKEFTLRIADGSTSTKDALAGIGLSADEMAAKLNSGELTKASAFDLVLEKLNDVDDATTRDQLATALLGTQYEDLGLGAALAISTTSTSLADMAGATDTLNAKYADWPSWWEGIKRNAVAALEPIGQQLLSLANEALPYVQAAFTWMQEELPPLIEQASAVISAMVETVKGLFGGDLATTLSTSQGDWSTTFQMVQDIVSSTGELVMTIIEAMTSFYVEHQETIDAITSTVWANLKTTIDTTLGVIQGIIQTITAAIKGDWSGVWEGIKGIAVTLLTGIKDTINNNLKLAQQLGTEALNALKGAAATAFEALRANAAEKIDAAKSAITSKLEEARSAGASTIEGLKSAITTAVENARTAALSTFEDLKTGIRGKIQDGVDIVKGFGTSFYNAGAGLVDNIKSAFLSEFNTLLDAIKSKLQELRDLFPGSEPKDASSPLRNMGRAGRALISNMQAGIDGASLNINAPTSTLQSQAQGVQIGGAVDVSLSMRDGLEAYINAKIDNKIGAIGRRSDISRRTG